MESETNSHEAYSYGSVTDADHRQFSETLGLTTTEVPDEPTLTDFRSAIGIEQTDELAEMGETVKASLSSSLDATELESALSALAEQFERIPELRARGFPEHGETPYQELTEPAWRVHEHLVETGFVTSAEDALPPFTPDHIETTTRQLLRMESLGGTLASLGFTQDERVALVTNVVNASERLSWWEPTINYPSASDEGFEDGVDYEYVPPLHERAMGGALLWIDGLDWYLWQNEVLVTDEMLARGIWDVRSMLAGAYLLGDAARRVATSSISDADLATLITAGSATAIIGQEFLEEDVVRITDEERAPRRAARDDQRTTDGGGW